MMVGGQERHCASALTLSEMSNSGASHICNPPATTTPTLRNVRNYMFLNNYLFLAVRVITSK